MSYGVEKEPHLGGYWLGGDPNSYATEVWEYMIKTMNLRNLLDVGCGEGQAMQYFHERGVFVEGVEGGELAIQNNPLRDHVFKHDYTTGPFIPSKIYDAAWCAEFVEHVDQKFEQNFLETFAKCRYVLMTHAFPGQEGYHHVNCQPPEYWISRMQEFGFWFDLDSSHVLSQSTKAEHVRRSLLVIKNLRYEHPWN